MSGPRQAPGEERWLLPTDVRTQCGPPHLSQQTTLVSVSLCSPESTNMLSFEEGDGAGDDMEVHLLKAKQDRDSFSLHKRKRGLSSRENVINNVNRQALGTRIFQVEREPGLLSRRRTELRTRETKENLQASEGKDPSGRLPEDETSDANISLNTIRFNEWKLLDGCVLGEASRTPGHSVHP